MLLPTYCVKLYVNLERNIDYGCNGWLAMLFFFKLLSLQLFLSLAFGRIQTLKVEHYYCILLTPIISAYVLGALACADIANNVPADELHL